MFLNFFIWDIKVLNIIFLIFQVDPDQPMLPETWLLGRVNPRIGFNNYG